MTNSNNTEKTQVSFSFEELGLPKHIITATHKMGFKQPSEIQQLAIPQLLNDQDVTAIAQTGTGKTAAFGLPMLSKLHFDNNDNKRVKALIMCPTRELAIQSSNAIGVMAMSANLHDFKITAIYGGASFSLQKREILDGLDVIVATPGRLVDMLNRKIIKLDEVKMVVLDEADEMLKMGFTEDVDYILSKVTQQNVQTCFFSATMPNGILKISQKYQNNPIEVKASITASTNSDVEQFYSVVPNNKKIEATRRLILNSSSTAALVFVKTRASTTEVSESLTHAGIKATAISGDVSQNERERIVEGVRKGKIKVLVATDVAARGLDIKQIGLVINYDLPTENDAYVHRIGRTGRAGRKGLAISLVNPSQAGKLRTIEKLIDKKIDQKSIPTINQIAAKQVSAFVEQVPERLGKGGLEKYENIVRSIPVFENIQYDQDAVECIAAILALSINDNGVGENTEFSEHLDSRGTRGESGDGRRRGGGGRQRNRSRDRERGDRYRESSGNKSGDRKGRERSVSGSKDFGSNSEQRRGGKSSGKKYDKPGNFKKKDKQGGKKRY